LLIAQNQKNIVIRLRLQRTIFKMSIKTENKKSPPELGGEELISN